MLRGGRIRKICFAVVGLCLFSAFQCAAQTPSPTPDPSKKPNAITEILKLLNPSDPTKIDGAVVNLSKTAVKIIQDSMLWSQKMNLSLKSEAQEVASTLLWAVLFAEITFSGFRLMLGSSIVEQLGLLTTKTFIYVIVSGLAPFPGANAPWNTAEGIIRSTMFRMMYAGKKIGATVIKEASHPDVLKMDSIKGIDPNSVEIPDKLGWAAYDVPPAGAPFVNMSYMGGGGYGDAGAWGPKITGSGSATLSGADRAEPMLYWMAWLGVEYASLYTYDGDGYPDVKPNWNTKEYKYSQISLNARIWGEDPAGQDTTSARLQKKQNEAASEAAKLAQEGKDSGTNTESVVGNFATAVLMGSMPLQMFGLAMSVAGIQIGSLITVTFAQMSILVGSIAAFNVASALGLAVLPLMYFRMFDKIWSQYLIGLGSLALVPFLFYILSAMGFVFATFIFEQLFPLPPSVATSAAAGGASTASLAVLLNDLFFAAVSSTMSSFTMVTSIISGLFGATITLLIAIYVNLGRIMFGSAVVASFVTAGSMFALLAPRFAFKWQSGFGAEDVMEKIGEVFNGIQSAVGSGMGQMYADAIQRGGQVGQGALRGLKRP